MDFDKEFNWVNNRIIYSLSFILIIYELKDLIVSWFPKNFSLEIYKFHFTVLDLINSMLIILLVSLYLYGINYLIKNPLNKIKIYLNYVASFLWFLFLVFPLIILTTTLLNLALKQPDGLSMLILTIFLIVNTLMSIWFERQSRKIDSFLIDYKIQNLRLKYNERDHMSEFIRNYLKLELLLKKALLNKTGVSLVRDSFVNLQTIINLLLDKKWIAQELALEIKDIIKLRNFVIHGEHKITHFELEKIEKIISQVENSLILSS